MKPQETKIPDQMQKEISAISTPAKINLKRQTTSDGSDFTSGNDSDDDYEANTRSKDP